MVFSPFYMLFRKSIKSGFESSCPKMRLKPTSVKGLIYLAISHLFSRFLLQKKAFLAIPPNEHADFLRFRPIVARAI